MIKLKLKEQDVFKVSRLALKHNVKMRVVGEEILLVGDNELKVFESLIDTPKEERVHIRAKKEPETLYEMKLKKVFRGGIYWVDFGNDVVGSEQGTKSLAIVVQNNIGNCYSPTTIVVPLTGVSKKELPTHLSFKITPETTEFCAIRNYQNITNTALAEQIQTVDKERICNCVAKLNTDLMAMIDEKIMISLGLKGIPSNK